MKIVNANFSEGENVTFATGRTLIIVKVIISLIAVMNLISDILIV